MHSIARFFAALMLFAAPPALAQNAPPPEPDPIAVEQMRHAIGLWDVETDFIGPEGKLLGTAKGEYHFEWVVEDRIVSGTSTIPAWDQTSAILFFVRPRDNAVEMTSVGPDGMLWRMIGPDDGETRTTPNVTMPDGSTMMLRFTRHGVTPDSFGSTMEISADGGETWRIGNRQRFVRKAGGEKPEK